MPASSSPDIIWRQATALWFDGCGLMLRGPSGCGKSLLALHLLDRANMLEKPAALISDDLVGISHQSSARAQSSSEVQNRHDRSLRLVAPKQNAGRIELRFFGIVERPFIAEANLNLIVDFVPEAPRLPEGRDLWTHLDPNEKGWDNSQKIACCLLPTHPAIGVNHQALIIEERLKNLQAQPNA